MGPNETSKRLHSKGNYKEGKKTKRQPSEWEKVFANHMSSDLYLRYIKNFKNSIKRKIIPLKNEQRIRIDISSKTMYK